MLAIVPILPVPLLLLAAPGAYHLDPAASSLSIKVYKAGVASPALHDHLFQPSTWTATVRFDPADPASAHVEMSIDAASLHDTNRELSDSDEKKVDAEAHKTVLDVDQFPTIAVTADRYVATAGSAGTWTGTLPATITLHGVSKPVDVPLTLSRAGSALHATGAVDVKQSEFGIKPFSKALGTIKIKDVLHISFDVTAVPDR